MFTYKLYVSFIVFILFFGCLSMFYSSFSKSNFIPLKVLFGSPQKSNPKISPDGKNLAYIAPIDGVRNIWVRTLGKNDDKPITNQLKRDITSCFWSYDNENLFYIRDKAGDENFHLYTINIKTKKDTDITPFEGVKVSSVVSYKKQFPHEFLFTMNKRDKKVFDVYKLDLITNDLTLVAKNPGNINEDICDTKS